MPQTVRVYWRNLYGRVRLNHNWDAIDRESVVLVTASEWALDPTSPQTSPRFIGAADVTVRNISPHGPPTDPNRGVTFVVDVNWNSPIDIVTDVTVLDDGPVDIQVQPRH